MASNKIVGLVCAKRQKKKKEEEKNPSFFVDKK